MTDYDNYNTNGVITRDVNDWSNMPGILRIKGNPNKPVSQMVHTRRVELTIDDKRFIVESFKDGALLKQIADDVGVEIRHIRRILTKALGDRQARKQYVRSHTNAQ